jgi:hypothetical protein
MLTSVQFETKKTPMVKETWRFVLIDNTLYLDDYQLIKRESIKHKFEKVKKYDRLDHRAKSYMSDYIKKEDVPLTDEIKEKALQTMIRKISVELWDRKK